MKFKAQKKILRIPQKNNLELGEFRAEYLFRQNVDMNECYAPVFSTKQFNYLCDTFISSSLIFNKELDMQITWNFPSKFYAFSSLKNI